MQVKLYATFRQAAGTKMVDVEASPGMTLRDLLLELTRRYPVLHKSIWNEQGELTELVHVFINGENIRQRDGLNTSLQVEDHVDIFPPVVGG